MGDATFPRLNPAFTFRGSAAASAQDAPSQEQTVSERKSRSDLYYRLESLLPDLTSRSEVQQAIPVARKEGAKYNAEGMVNYFREHRERLGFDLRVTKLGHVQRAARRVFFDGNGVADIAAALTRHRLEN